MENVAGEPAALPMVSVIVPCRDEARFIGACLDSIAASDYPKELLEVLVIDGASTDGTRDIIEDLARQYPLIRRIPNEKLTTPVALNLGIRAARGAYIVWMSAHNTYPPDYITQSIDWAERSGADNVGGVIVTRPRSAGLWAQGVATALTHPFGVGASHFRVQRPEPAWVDTVFGGCYRRTVFDRIGLFNEQLTRGQDMEFNLRLQRAGGRTLLVPQIQSIYYARTRPLEFAKHTWSNGEWAILPFLHSVGSPVGARHLVPMAFALAILAGIILGAIGWSWLPLAVVGGAYVLANVLGSAHAARRERKLALLVAMPAVFTLLHLSYGFGSVSGLLRLIAHRARAVVGR
jgi:glycosyltransferase involved in cell wall biosynthesis